jgi:anti-sigma regulatory factor (Ser/Thr protein kinase)
MLVGRRGGTGVGQATALGETIKVNVMSCAVEQRLAGFEHHAVFYEGVDQLVAVLLPFIREGVQRDEPVLVALRAAQVQALVRALGTDARAVDFVDMERLGANPACILPEWRRFVQDAAGGPVRGVGEPIWSGRRGVELEEAVLHEALLNMAFDGGPAWQLLCPYDVSTLPSEVLEDAARTHPVAVGAEVGGSYTGPEQGRSLFRTPLPAAPTEADMIEFGPADLAGLRDLVHRLAAQAQLPAAEADDVVLAAHELATNSIVHGGEAGVLRCWVQPDAFVVEVSDGGVIDDPLVGRGLLDDFSENGRGIWMANQLCDLVQVRSGPEGTAVRIFAWL